MRRASSGANSIKDAYAKMEWISGPYIYTCTGGLLNDSNPSSTNYFLTANHCLSRTNRREERQLLLEVPYLVVQRRLPEQQRLAVQDNGLRGGVLQPWRGLHAADVEHGAAGRLGEARIHERAGRQHQRRRSSSGEQPGLRPAGLQRAVRVDFGADVPRLASR